MSTLKINTIGQDPTEDVVIPGPQGWAKALGEVPPGFLTIEHEGITYVWAQEFRVRKVLTGDVEHTLQPLPTDIMHQIDFTQPQPQ